MEEEIILHTEDLAVGYDGHALVKDIAFALRKGEILVLIGPNGAGKSTLLRSITGQLKEIAGTVFIEKEELHRMDRLKAARKMAILSTQRPSAELMTVYDMICTGRYPYTGRLGILADRDRQAVEEAIDMVQLQDIREKEFLRISDGQKQLVMLARAICQEPEILIMDEPTSFLDIHHKLEILRLLKKLTIERHVAVILSLHELGLSQKCADHLLCVGHGKAEQYGTPEEIFRSGCIEELYGMPEGSFIPEFGSVELEKVSGNPEVFVIGGGGSGIDLYRRLQRQGIPFSAGVIAENDVEYPVVCALASELISSPAFEPVNETEVEKALRLMDNCSRVICAVKHFGTMNEGLLKLKKKAGEDGKLEEI